MFEDNFSQQAHVYARHRPQYPSSLFAYLVSQTPGHALAWDCGTGNGQAARGLVNHFERVWATDPSQEQIDRAQRHPRILYRVLPAEACGLPDQSCDLVTAAQAAHWFDLDLFYHEVRRVLKPGGVLAIWGYKGTRISPKVDPILNEFYYGIVGPFWSPRVRLVEQHYRTIPFPFPELPCTNPFTIEVNWTLPDLIGYIESWSSVQKYRELLKEDPVPALAQDLEQVWGDLNTPRRVRWKLALRVGRYEK